MKKLFLFSLIFLMGCTYTRYWKIHSGYKAAQHDDPSLAQLRYLIDVPNYFVYGKTVDVSGSYDNKTLSVVAISSEYKPHEQVDAMHSAKEGTFFALNLPEGSYQLLVFMDHNGDEWLSEKEVVGSTSVVVSEATATEQILPVPDIRLTDKVEVDFEISMALPAEVQAQHSLFYPAGTIRSLQAPVFERRIATMGLYDPASFVELAPTMFYALEEDMGHKIPVIFVHGIGGTSREFIPILNQLDRQRFKPWFFYYPSGGDLNQLSELFYQIFLSGKVVPSMEMPMVVVAHSMGGLIVRESINKYRGRSDENEIALFISMAAPFGGHASAALGEKHAPVVLPAWRDLNPENEFIKHLYRQPLPDFLDHQLLYAYRNKSAIKLGENSDGTVAVASQLHPVAQNESTGQFGVNTTHAGILTDDGAIEFVLEKLDEIENFYPEEQLSYLHLGGYDVDLGNSYKPETQFIVENYGKFLTALANGQVEAVLQGQKDLIQVLNGRTKARNTTEKELLKFKAEYPQYFEVQDN